MEKKLYLSEFQRKRTERDARIKELYAAADGLKWVIMAQIAKEVGVTITTVYRVVGKEPK